MVILATEPWVPGDPLYETSCAKQEVWQGHPVWRIYARVRHSMPEWIAGKCGDESLRPLFQSILDDVKPDLVHVFHFMYLTTVLAEEVKLRQIPLYFTMTDYWLLCPTFQMLKWNEQLCGKATIHGCLACLLSQYSQWTTGQKRWLLQLARSFPRLAGIAHPMLKSFSKVLTDRINKHREFFNSLADGVFFPNRFSQRMFHAHQLKNSHEVLLPFPLPARAETLRMLPQAPPSDRLRVAFIGTLLPAKGPEVLLKACQQLHDTRWIQVDLWGGQGGEQYEEYLRSLANGAEWISFRGTFRQEEFASVLNNIDVVVIPSIWYENTPLTALSVLAAKKVLVASNVGGLAELIQPGETGFLFPPGDFRSLAMILSGLIEERGKLLRYTDSIKSPLRTHEYVDGILQGYCSEQNQC